MPVRVHATLLDSLRLGVAKTDGAKICSSKEINIREGLSLGWISEGWRGCSPAQERVKAVSAKPDDLRSVPGWHVVEGEN